MSAAIIWGALRSTFDNEKAGKAMSPISEFLGVSSKFKIASWSRLSMTLANSLAINSFVFI
jgi:hypothetical protein